MYEWKAVYLDKVIDQYPRGQPENTSAALGVKSGEFWLDHDLPESFYLGKKYGIDLKTGAVLFDGKGIQITDKDGQPLAPVAMLYCRHCHAQLNTGGGEVKPLEVTHVCGYRTSSGQVVTLRVPEDGVPSISIGK